MQELYYWGNSKGYTWKQLLYSISKFILSRQGDKYWYNKNYIRVNNFFIDYSHNDNDGYYTFERKKGEYLYSAYYCNLQTRGLCFQHYYAPDYTIKVFHPKRNRVTDSYGRIIPSCQIKDALRTYIINEADNPNQRKYWYRYYLGGSKYRRRWHTSRFKGNHGFLGNECRQNMIFKTEEKSILDEFSIKVKYNKSRASEVKSLYTDWDSRDIYGAIKRSWKRSKKRKQWM